MNINRKNHFIPQSYIKNWSSSKEVYIHRRLVSNKNVPVWEKKAIKGIGYYPDLYIDYIDSNETDEVEKWFDREIENPVEDVFAKIIKGKKLEPDDHKKITKFTLAQYVRTPKHFKKNIAKRDPNRIKTLMDPSSDEVLIRRDGEWNFFRIIFYVMIVNVRTSNVSIIFHFDFMGSISLMILFMTN